MEFTAGEPYGDDIYTEPDGDPDTLANLGPLRPMAGVWEGDQGADHHPVARRDRGERVRRALRAAARSTARPTGPSSSTACGTTPTSPSPARSRPSTTRSATGSGSRRPGRSTLTLGIPRAQVAAGRGPAEPDATEFELHGHGRLRGLRHPVQPVPRPGLPYPQLSDPRHGATPTGPGPTRRKGCCRSPTGTSPSATSTATP